MDYSWTTCGPSLNSLVRRQRRVDRRDERCKVVGARGAVADVEEEALGVDVGRRRDAEAHLVRRAGPLGHTLRVVGSRPVMAAPPSAS